MAESKNWYLICYDIRDPKRWRKAYKLLKGYGETVQYSIICCWLNQRDREKLRWELAQILSPEDSLLVVGLCHRCMDRIQKCNCIGAWASLHSSYRII